MKINVEYKEDINTDFKWTYGINWNYTSKGECWHLVYAPF